MKNWLLNAYEKYQNSTIDIQQTKYLITPNDQKQPPPKRNRQPSSQLSTLMPKTDFYGSNSVLDSFGPLSNAIEITLLSQKIIPIILAMLLKLRILTSILVNFKTFRTCKMLM